MSTLEQAREWLKLVRGEGDDGTKAQYLRERGFSQEDIDRLLREEEAEAQNNCVGCSSDA